MMMYVNKEVPVVGTTVKACLGTMSERSVWLHIFSSQKLYPASVSHGQQR